MKYTLVGDHSEVLEDGSSLAPGDEVELSSKELEQEEGSRNKNKELVDEGRLVSTQELKKEERDLAQTGADNPDNNDTHEEDK